MKVQIIIGLPDLLCRVAVGGADHFLHEELAHYGRTGRSFLEIICPQRLILFIKQQAQGFYILPFHSLTVLLKTPIGSL